MFRCSSCLEFLEDSKKKLGRGSTCKKCNSINTSMREIRLKVEKNPERYLLCDSCDRYFSTAYRYSGKCRYCGSKEVHNVLDTVYT